MKLFPAATLGPRYLRDLRGPLGDIPLLATGGVDVDNATAMVDAGYEDQLLLSSDLGRPQDFKANWGSGYSTVVTVFVPKLRYAGVKEATIQKVLVDNPRRFLAFVPKSV